MIRRAGLCALLTFLALTGFAQDETEVSARRSSHYVGIQANQLLKQLFSLGNSNTVINNPYMMTYSVNSIESGIGWGVGLGFTINEINDDFGVLRIESKIKDIFFRTGIEKKSVLTKRWILTVALDVVIDSQSDKTRTFDPINPGNSETTTKNRTNGFGIGPRCSLFFHINDKILLGTEANYYLKALTTRTELSSPNPNSQPDNKSSDVTRFQLNVPAVLFLIVKF